MNIEDEYPSGADEAMRREYERKKRVQKEEQEERHKQDAISANEMVELPDKSKKSNAATDISLSDKEITELDKDLEEICKCRMFNGVSMPKRITYKSVDQNPLYGLDSYDDVSENLEYAFLELQNMKLYTQGFDSRDLRWCFSDEATKWNHYPSEIHSYDARQSLRDALQFIKEVKPKAFRVSDQKIVVVKISKDFSAKADLFRTAHTIIAEFFSSCIKSNPGCSIDYVIAEDPSLFGTSDLNVDVYSGVERGYKEDIDEAKLIISRIYKDNGIVFNGVSSQRKSAFAREIVKKYVRDHSNLSFLELQANLSPELGSPIINDIESIKKWIEDGHQSVWKGEILTSGDGVQFKVYDQWKDNDRCHNFQKVLAFAKKMGYIK